MGRGPQEASGVEPPWGGGGGGGLLNTPLLFLLCANMTLDMSGCDQHTITDDAFVHLKSIQVLGMDWCNQPAITGGAFTHLTVTQKLYMKGCRPQCIEAAKDRGLPVRV